MRRINGFTLIELMIVISIVGIIASIAIPQFAAYRNRGLQKSGPVVVKEVQRENGGIKSISVRRECIDGFAFTALGGEVIQVRNEKGGGVPCK